MVMIVPIIALNNLLYDMTIRILIVQWSALKQEKQSSGEIIPKVIFRAAKGILDVVKIMYGKILCIIRELWKAEIAYGSN